MAGVSSTCASLSNSIPGCLNTVSAAPISTRSDCLGLKFAQPVPPDRSGFFEPPVQPLAPPRSERCMTAARAACCPAAVRWICSLSATAAPASTSAAASAPAPATTCLLTIIPRPPIHSLPVASKRSPGRRHPPSAGTTGWLTNVGSDVRALLAIGAAGVAALLAIGGVAAAKAPPPPPRAGGGRTGTLVARGGGSATAFAAVGGRLFVAAYGANRNSTTTGGVYLLGGGKAIRVPGSPAHVYGLAAVKGTLYVSAGKTILAWSNWNGKRFEKARIIAT